MMSLKWNFTGAGRTMRRKLFAPEDNFKPQFQPSEASVAPSRRSILAFTLGLLLWSIPFTSAGAVLWQEGFEGAVSGWTIEGTANVWQFGAPTSGPGAAFAGQAVSGTVLAGNYSANTDTRLASPAFEIPAAGEYPRLKYAFWSQMLIGDFGQVQVRVSGGEWQDAPGGRVGRSATGSWSQQVVDLRPWAGQTVQIGFRFVTDSGTGSTSVGAGWYLDEVSVVTGAPVFPQPTGFESDWGDWSAEGDAWQFGPPTAANGPGPFAGNNVAGTVLGADYSASMDGRLVSPEFLVPAAGQQPRFKYAFWAQLGAADFGQLQVRVAGQGWEDVVGNRAGPSNAGEWSQSVLDLRPWAGQMIQVGFRFTSDSGTGSTSIGSGWFIDEVSLETGTPVFPQPTDFETDWGDWSVEGGVWQIGPPTAANGPEPFSGANVAGTVLGANYSPSMDGRLASPEFLVPVAGEHPRFKYAYWYQLGSGDFGQVQVRVNGGTWEDIEGDRFGLNNAGEWSQRVIDLRPWAGQSVQIGFRFTTDSGTASSSLGPGWFIDDASLETGTPVFPQPTDFESDWGDWSAEGGVWQIGPPTAADGPEPFSGQNVAGTILGGNYSQNMDARLVSPEFLVPEASERPRFKYAYWYRFGSGDFGQVQVRVNGGAWEDIEDDRFGVNTSGEWSQRVFDLRPWAGQSVQIGFRFTSDSGTTSGSLGQGWFIDEVSMETGTPLFPNPTGFEETWGDWSAQGGVWQIGTPTAANGPQPQFGENVAGTILDGSYSQNVNARFVSPEFIVPVASANPQLSFWHWLLLGSGDSAVVQIRTGGGPWTNLGLGTQLGAPVNGWSNQLIDLTPYAGQAVEVAFRLLTDSGTTSGSLGPGWFLDEIGVISDTLDPIANQVIPESAEFRLPLVSRGTDLRFNFHGPAPAGAMVGPTASEFVWTPAEDQGPGVYNDITVWVTQPDNSLTPIDAQSFDITVNEINVAPTLTVPPTQTVNELSALNVSVSAMDPDIPVNALTFSLIDPPAGMAIDASTGAITWTPTEAQGPEEYPIIVRVTDHNPDAVNEQQLSDTKTFTVIVREVNHAPVLTVPADQVIDELQPWSIAATATDIDLPANPLTFTLIDPPAGMTIHANTGVITWTPSEAQGPNSYTITVRVTDNSPNAVNEQQLSDTKTFTVTVNEVNHAPVLPVQADRTINELTLLTVVNTATDSDIPANPLAYNLTVAPEGAVISANGVITWTPTEAQGPNTYTFTTVVTDQNDAAVNQKQLSATNSFTVTVNEMNHAPVLTVPPNQTINELTSLNVSASATDSDIPANPLTFSLVNPPAGMTINPNTGAITWTPTEAQGPSTNVITVVVTDNNPAAINEQQLSDTKTFTVIVNEVNLPPVLAAIADVSQHYSQPVSIQAIATDPDLPANTLTYSLDEAPAGMTINSSTGLISWNPGSTQVGAYSVTVRVTDHNPWAVNEQQFSDTVTFEITITGEGSILAITRLSGNFMQLTITGDLGQYELLISTDLIEWTRLDLLQVTSSPRLYIDPASPGAPIRYYRLRFIQE